MRTWTACRRRRRLGCGRQRSLERISFSSATAISIIGSNESCRVMRERGVPKGQLLPSQGGERHRLADGVTASVFPSLHACTWILGEARSGDEEQGHEGLTQDERASLPGLNQRIGGIAPEHPEI